MLEAGLCKLEAGVFTITLLFTIIVYVLTSLYSTLDAEGVA